MTEKLKRVAPALLALAFLVVAWEVLARALKVPQFIVPLPSAVFQEFQAKWLLLPRHMWFTMAIILAGCLPLYYYRERIIRRFHRPRNGGSGAEKALDGSGPGPVE